MVEAVTSHEDDPKSQSGTIGRRGLSYVALAAIQAGALVVLVPIITRSLTPDEFAAVQNVQFLARVTGLVATAGLPTIVLRELHRARSSAQAADVMRLGSRTVAVMTAVALASASVLPEQVGRLFGGDFVIMAGVALGAGLAMSLLLQGYARGREDLRLYAASGLGHSVIGPVVGLLLLVGPIGGVLAYIGGWAATSLAIGCLGVFIVQRVMSRSSGVRSDRLPPQRVKSLLMLGIPLALTGLATTVTSLSDRVVVSAVAGLVEAGRYAVAYQLGSLPLLILIALNQQWLVDSVAADRKRVWRLMAAQRRQLTLLVFVLSFVVTVMAPLGLRILAPSSYLTERSVPTTSILALGAVVHVYYTAAANILIRGGRTGYVAWAVLPAAFANIALTVWLASSLGSIGAAVATAATFTIMAVVATSLARQAYPDYAGIGSNDMLLLFCCAALVLAYVLGLPWTWLIHGLVALGAGLRLLRTVRLPSVRSGP